jgi:hypothetical protein
LQETEAQKRERHHQEDLQRSDNGADPHRARYHSSVMDVENLDKDQDYRELPDSYVIFITEKDYYKAGKTCICHSEHKLDTGLAV